LLAWSSLLGPNHGNAILQAPTGSGKTLAFLLPALKHLREARQATSEEPQQPVLLVVVPTRELAVQLRTDMRVFGTRNVALAVYGASARWIAVEDADVLVGTPASLCELFDSQPGHVVQNYLSRIVALVLDELDALIRVEKAKVTKHKFNFQDKGMWPTEALVRRVLKRNAYPHLQILAASATPWKQTAKKLRTLLRQDPQQRFEGKGELRTLTDRTGAELGQQDENSLMDMDEVQLHSPTFKHSSGYAALPAAIRHYSWSVPSSSSHVAEVSQALEHLQPNSALIFVCPNAMASVETVVAELQQHGWRNASPLSRSIFKDSPKIKARARKARQKLRALSQEERAGRCSDELLDMRSQTRRGWQGLGGLSYKDAPVFVGAEESHRGIHLDAVEAVLIVGLPKSGSSYVHMAGRTGRLPYPRGFAALIGYPRTLDKVIGPFCRETRLDPRNAWTDLREVTPPAIARDDRSLDDERGAPKRVSSGSALDDMLGPVGASSVFE